MKNGCWEGNKVACSRTAFATILLLKPLNSPLAAVSPPEGKKDTGSRKRAVKSID